MIYEILLEDRNSGRTALIECPANMVLEELSVKIKVELQLPLCDYAWHRFLFKGFVYVVDEHVMTEPMITYDCTGRNEFIYYWSSEEYRLEDVYTTIGSAITYQQDGRCKREHRVRCTLVRRG